MIIKYYDECVKYALQQRGIAGDNFKETSLRVYQRQVANPVNLLKVLTKGGIVIPTIVDTLFGGNGFEFVATILIHVDEVAGEATLYVPATGQEQRFPLDAFIHAWEATSGLCTTAFTPDEKTYRPKLLNLSHVELPEVYNSLREAIAENAHDTWALERQSEGWTWGAQRDDSRLETPDMVPYDQLPESEKQYDRIMAADTLRLLLALGYKVVKE